MNVNKLREYINSKDAEISLCELYGADRASAQRERYLQALSAFCDSFGERENIDVFSVPGRSELSGNHTDHNRGCVIAASVSLDIIGVAAKNNSSVININSDGFGTYSVDISKYTSPAPAMFGTSESIIAGVCCGFSERGYVTGGFDAYVTSDVLGGSGLSSSAAFENMIGNILNHMYNNGRIDNVDIAVISQYAENKFFGKPCGLMDQVACAVGGIVAIDFADPASPQIEPISFDMTSHGYNLCIVNTGGNHADLTPDYAAVPSEMKATAAELSCNVLRELHEQDVVNNIPTLRRTVGDRAILRSLHFFEENKRVEKQKTALKQGNIEEFLSNVRASGRSSFCYLQNVYTVQNVAEQGLSLALCLAEITLSDKSAAWRVHGGGFAGTAQVIVRCEDTQELRDVMDACFGSGACMVLSVRKLGAVRVFPKTDNLS